MVIDLTTLPVTVLPDECSSSVVVRTWDAFGVHGLVGRKYLATEGAEKRHDQILKPGAQASQGAITCYETRIPLMNSTVPTRDFTPSRFLQEPWEVSTGAKDVVTGHTLTWRAWIQIQEHPKNKGLWVVSIGRDGEPMPLVRLACKGLVEGFGVVKEPLPLSKFVRQTVQAEAPTQWDRLVEDEF